MDNSTKTTSLLSHKIQNGILPQFLCKFVCKHSSSAFNATSISIGNVCMTSRFCASTVKWNLHVFLASKHPKHKQWFQANKNIPHTRSSKPQYKEPLSRLTRYKNSPIPYLTRLLNET